MEDDTGWTVVSHKKKRTLKTSQSAKESSQAVIPVGVLSWADDVEYNLPTPSHYKCKTYSFEG